MIVTLGAVEPQSQEGARDSPGQADGVGLVFFVLLAGDAHKVCSRPVGPETIVGNQLLDDLVIGPVLRQRIGEPSNEAATAKVKERAILGPDIGASQPFGE